MTGKYINASTLKSMFLIKTVDKLETDLKESMIVSDLMTNFPPIFKEDNPKVLVVYVTTHYEQTGKIINLSSIPDTMAGVPLIVASKKRKSKKTTSKVVEVSEPKPKKQKKSKTPPQLNVVELALPTIQEEISDLEPIKILEKRTRGGSSEVASSQPKPNVQKKKRIVRKMRVSDYEIQEEDEVEDTTALVTRIIREKKAATKREVDKALAIASDIEVPAESLLKESTAADAQKVVELVGGIQELVKTGDLLKDSEEVQKGKSVCSETACSEALSLEATEIKGNTSSHIISNDITELDSTSTSHSSDTIDDIPLSKVYKTLEKSLAPSTSTKTQKKPADDEFVPMYPIVLERIGNMAQMRIDVCQNLPANHPLQPPFIQPLQTISPDVQFKEVQNEQASNNVTSS